MGGRLFENAAIYILEHTKMQDLNKNPAFFMRVKSKILG